MKQFFILLILATFAIVTTGIQSAEAKRFGGGMSFGKSFGSKQRAAPPRSFGQQSTGQQKAVPSKQASQRGSARTGMMGGIAGLALGGLLGAMFFGGGFEGLNFFDILIFAGIAWLLFTLFKRKTSGMQFQQQAATSDRSTSNQSTFDQSTFDQSAAPFDLEDDTSADIQGHAVKPNIDEAFFLKVSKDIFIRMQAAWDLGNMDEIRSFCTPEIALQIEQDLQSGNRKNNTEVATLNAVISDTWVESELEWAAVHFTAMLKEESLSAEGNIEEEQRHEVQEHWIFQHDPTSDDPTWYLAGIQQP